MLSSSQVSAFHAIQQEFHCTICHRMFEDPQCLACKHNFCRECIEIELKKKYSPCPICTLPMYPNEMQRNQFLSSVIESWKEVEKNIQPFLVDANECNLEKSPAKKRTNEQFLNATITKDEDSSELSSDILNFNECKSSNNGATVLAGEVSNGRLTLIKDHPEMVDQSLDSSNAALHNNNEQRCSSTHTEQNTFNSASSNESAFSTPSKSSTIITSPEIEAYRLKIMKQEEFLNQWKELQKKESVVEGTKNHRSYTIEEQKVCNSSEQVMNSENEHSDNSDILVESTERQDFFISPTLNKDDLVHASDSKGKNKQFVICSTQEDSQVEEETQNIQHFREIVQLQREENEKYLNAKSDFATPIVSKLTASVKDDNTYVKKKISYDNSPSSSGTKGNFRLNKNDPNEFVIVATDIHDLDDLNLIKKCTKKFGGRFGSKFHKIIKNSSDYNGNRVTHVVTSGVKLDGISLRCKRTIKYMRGMAEGCWIVDLSWVKDSWMQEKWLDEDTYEIQGDIYTQNAIGKPKYSRELKTMKFVKNLLEDFVFFRMCPSAAFNLPEHDLSQLLVALGSVSFQSTKELERKDNFQQKIKLGIVDKSYPVKDCIRLAAKYQILVIRVNWIFDCISCWKILPYEKYNPALLVT